MVYPKVESVNIKQEFHENISKGTRDEQPGSGSMENDITENIFIKIESMDILNENLYKDVTTLSKQSPYIIGTHPSSPIKNKNYKKKPYVAKECTNETNNLNIGKINDGMISTKENYDAAIINRKLGNNNIKKIKIEASIDNLLTKDKTLQDNGSDNKHIFITAASFYIANDRIKSNVIEQFPRTTNHQSVLHIDKNELIVSDQVACGANNSSKHKTSLITELYCDMCNFKTNTKPKIRSHILLHKDKNSLFNQQRKICIKKIYTCKFCGQTFICKKDLSGHKKTHSGEKRFACNFCDQKFLYKSIMERHVTTHTGLKPFPCDICNHKFIDKTALDRHMLTHTGEKPFSCSVCPNRFARKSNLLRHIKTHTGEKPFKCNICGNMFSQKGNLWKHIRTHTGEKPFSCTICGNRFSQKTNLLNHLKMNTGGYPRCLQNKYAKKEILPDQKPFLCTSCDRRFLYKSTLVRHKKTHSKENVTVDGDKLKKNNLDKHTTASAIEGSHISEGHIEKSVLIPHIESFIGKKPFSYVCQGNIVEGTRSDGNLDNKLSTSDKKCIRRNNRLGIIKIQPGDKPFACDLCPSNFRQKHHLQRHVKTHTGEKSWSCELCQFRCAESYSLVKHMRTHTGEKPYACKFCVYRCTSSSHLTEHIRTHTGEKPYECKFCEYRGASCSNLTEHIRIHTGEKPYKCTICHNRFTLRSNLAKHLRTHTGEKPFSCTFCQYKCSNPSALVRHVRTHTGEKPYTCDYCPSKFTQKCHLAIHARTHSGDKPFPCELCEYKFAQKSNLIKHLKTHIKEHHFSRSSSFDEINE